MVDIDTQYLNNLYEENKQLQENLSWEPDNPEIGRYHVKAEVVTTRSNEPLTFHAKRWGTGEYSFAIQYGSIMVRQWDMEDHPGTNGQHKHKFKYLDTNEEEVYEVNDINKNDVNQGLEDALDQFNIDTGPYDIEELNV